MPYQRSGRSLALFRIASSPVLFLSFTKPNHSNLHSGSGASNTLKSLLKMLHSVHQRRMHGFHVSVNLTDEKKVSNAAVSGCNTQPLIPQVQHLLKTPSTHHVKDRCYDRTSIPHHSPNPLCLCGIFASSKISALNDSFTTHESEKAQHSKNLNSSSTGNMVRGGEPQGPKGLP